MTRPINAIINLNNLKFNLEKLKALTASKLIVVAKANAYGHDLVKCLKILKIADGNEVDTKLGLFKAFLDHFRDDSANSKKYKAYWKDLD